MSVVSTFLPTSLLCSTSIVRDCVANERFLIARIAGLDYPQLAIILTATSVSTNTSNPFTLRSVGRFDLPRDSFHQLIPSHSLTDFFRLQNRDRSVDFLCLAHQPHNAGARSDFYFPQFLRLVFMKTWACTTLAPEHDIGLQVLFSSHTSDYLPPNTSQDALTINLPQASTVSCICDQDE